MPKRSGSYPQYPEKKSKISFFIGKIYISMKIRDISEYLIRRKVPRTGEPWYHGRITLFEETISSYAGFYIHQGRDFE
jgi:hypothetical protein